MYQLLYMWYGVVDESSALLFHSLDEAIRMCESLNRSAWDHDFRYFVVPEAELGLYDLG